MNDINNKDNNITTIFSARAGVSTNRVRLTLDQLKTLPKIKAKVVVGGDELDLFVGRDERWRTTRELAGLGDRWDLKDLRRALQAIVDGKKIGMSFKPTQRSFHTWVAYSAANWYIPNGVVRLLVMLGIVHTPRPTSVGGTHLPNIKTDVVKAQTMLDWVQERLS